MKFDLKLGGTNQAQTLNVTGHGAAILAIGIKGGNDTTAYDYYGKDFPADGGTGWVSGDTNLHAPASKFQVNTNTTPPTETNITQYYGVSLLNVCYRSLATVSGEAFKDVAGDGSISVGDTGIDGLTATLKDTTTGQTFPTQLTKNGGLYSFGVPAGDSYQVCITAPTTFGNVQTAPTSTTTSPLNSVSCSGTGQAGWGYTARRPVGPAFRLRTVRFDSGLVYQDKSQPTDDSFDGNDAVLSGWTVTLYDARQPPRTRRRTRTATTASPCCSTRRTPTRCGAPAVR